MPALSQARACTCPPSCRRPAAAARGAEICALACLCAAALAMQLIAAASAQAQIAPPPTTAATIPHGTTSPLTIPKPGPKHDVIPAPPCTATLSADVLFAFNSAQLTSQGTTAIQNFITEHELLSRRERTIRIRIVGHTDSIGSDQYNLNLSLQRADAVRAVFLQMRIAATRVQAIGAGKSQPAVSPEITAADQAANRRVDIQLLKANGKPACEGEL